MNKLNIEDLSVVYHGKEKQVRAVDHVSFSVDAGDSLGIIGESGSGKSTMIHALLRLLPEKTGETQGHIWFDDTDLLTCDEKTLRKLRWKEIAVVFQRSMNSLSQIHTIGEQFEDVYRVHEPRAAKAQMKEIICGLFEKVNLNPRIYNMYPFELSGGMQQRLNIALSIMFSPALLIMDEATTALDVVTQGQILDELMEMEKTMSITRLMITHDLSVVATSCKKILVLYAGRLMEFGTVEDILKNPQHPYTQALVSNCASIDIDSHVEKIHVEGEPPSPVDPGPGCYFADRCPRACEKCRQEYPQETRLPDGRVVACHLVNEGVIQ